MKKVHKSLSAVGVVEFTVVVIMVFFLLYVFIFLDKISLFSLGSQISGGGTVGVSNEQGNVLPLSADHPNVVNGAYFYTLSAVVEEMTASTLRLSTKGEQLPLFPVGPSTPIYKKGSVGDVAVSMKDLKVGLNVLVTISYGYKGKQWQVNRIVIINPGSSK